MILAFGLFGLIIGSFLNVVVLRHGREGIGGRSKCMSCQREIAWYDNIPVLSYLFLRGRCRACGAHVSLQYPLVETLTAILFALVAGAALSLPLSVLACVVAALFIAIALYDLRTTLIPDVWVYPLALLALAFSFFSGAFTAQGTLFLFAGPIIALPLFLLWLVSGGRWMGLGDAKLALSIGWLLGLWYGYIALTLAFISGALIALLVLLPLPYYRALLTRWGLRDSSAGESFTMRSEVPFGPFLVSSTIVVWLLLLYHVPLPL